MDDKPIGKSGKKTPLYNKRARFLTALAVCLAFFAAVPCAFANVIGNGSFENPIGNGTAGNWDHTNNAVRTEPGDGVYPIGFSAPPDGNAALFLNVAADFSFQTYDLVQPGDFVSFSGLAESDVAAGSGGQLRIEFKRKNDDGTDSLISAVNSNLINALNAAPGAFVRFTVTGTAPPETGRVVFVIRRQGAAVGDVLFDNVNGEINPAKLAVSASKNRVKKGDVVTVFVRLRNPSGDALNNVILRSQVPSGIDLMTSSIRVDGREVAISKEDALEIPIPTVAAGQTIDTSFQVLVTSGVSIGEEYDLEVTVRDNVQLSESRRVRLIVESDPVFDQGTVIGKVFNDTNQNGVQDDCEQGVPWVRLVTEEGIVIITDEYGRYHIPGVEPGRHVIKIDGHSLPNGTRFITEEAYLIKTTPGLMSKANFAVLLPPSAIPENFQEDLVVWITQGLDTSAPVLDVRMEPEHLKTALGVLQREPVFKFDVNYPEFVKLWYLEVRDELGTEIWTGYGVSTPPAEVSWSGKANDGFLIKPGVYSYRLKVEDSSGRQDWTPLKFFRVSPANSENTAGESETIDPVGDFNIFKDGKRSIPLVAKPTLRVQGKTKPENKILVNGNPVPVDAASGYYKAEVYVSPGDKEVEVMSVSPEGETTAHRETVKVKDSTFFMVALGEEELGLNVLDGNVETAGREDEFKDGFYQDGRLAYYLQGKLKGKFLVKSSYDTGDKRSALFTNLDPDDYYPVYGDASTIDYEGQDTRQRFFVVVEMDRSFVKWGSFKTQFTDTELASYNRTLSGLKLGYDAPQSTAYGDPKRGFKLFWSKADHRADHNEFAATGGSLYYLRNRRVVEGSEKIRVEIRDKIQDMSIASYDLKEGTDYEIDYDEGRILLSRPLSSVAASDTIVSRDILDGSPVYLVVDYEFQADPDVFETKNQGIRGYVHMGNHIRVGGTAIEEQRQEADYNLRAVDMTVKAGRNTKVTAEYAQTINRQVNQSVSYNGGLTFADLAAVPSRQTREEAYLIKAESKPFKSFDMSGYVQGVEPGFSNDRIRSQEGFTKYGFAARFKPVHVFQVNYRFDVSQLRQQLQLPEDRSILAPYNQIGSHTFQATYDDNKWFAQAEYLKQNLEFPTGNLAPTLNSELDFENGMAGKLGYHLNDRLLPYAKVQLTTEGEKDNQFGGGVRYRVTNDVFAYVEQLFGHAGDSTYFGFEKFEGGTRSYANLRMYDRGFGPKTLATAIGSTFALSEKSRLFTEREHSAYRGVDGYADIAGYDVRLTDRWTFDAKYERRHLSNVETRLLDIEAAKGLLRNNTFNTIYGGLAYDDKQKTRSRTSLELRRDQDAPKMHQWVLRQAFEYKLNTDLSYLSKLDLGLSRFKEPDGTPASFTEFSTGFAYRPVYCDRLNLLTRYTYIKDIANDIQYATDLYQGMPTDERAHIVAIDLAYDLFKYLGLVEKLAYKRGGFKPAASDETVVNSFLSVNRLNFHVTRKWDIALEYRALVQAEAADALRHGPLVEVDREFYEYVRLGLGYNFTYFDDDLKTVNDFDSHGFFVRLSGKF